MDRDFRDRFGDPPPMLTFGVSPEQVLAMQAVVCALVLLLLQPPFVSDVSSEGYVTLSVSKTLAVVGIATFATWLLHRFDVNAKDAFFHMVCAAHRNLS